MGVWSFQKSYFFCLTCCVRVNSCSLTLMTAVHFLHQTDIGLALRKHEAIYGITPTLFSPSLSFPPSRVCLCALQTRARRWACRSAPAKLVPFSSAGFRHSARFVSLRRHLRLAATSIPLTPCMRFPLYGIVLLEILPRWLMTSEPLGKTKRGGEKTQQACHCFSNLPFINCSCVLPLSALRLLGSKGRFTLWRLHMGKIWNDYLVGTVSTEQVFVLFSQRLGLL